MKIIIKILNIIIIILLILNKTSEKLASNKNPNESKEQLYQRLHFEKLKNVKVMYKKPEQEKKITKKQANNLINKLYKERLKLKFKILIFMICLKIVVMVV